MPSGIEIAKAALDEFEMIQRYMALGKRGECSEDICGIEEQVSFIESHPKCGRRQSGRH